MSITPDEMVSPEAYREALERIEELEARLGGAQTEAQRYLELATRLEGERDMARFDLEITHEELVDTREERDAERLARVTESDRADGLEEMLTVVEVWRDELAARVAELERHPLLVGVPIDPATGLRVGNPDGVLVTLTEQVAQRVEAEARVVELEGRVHDLERDVAGAVELARRWRERARALEVSGYSIMMLERDQALRLVDENPILAQLLELSRRGVVPCGLYLRDWQRLEGVGFVEWRDGAYWRVEVSRG